MGLLLFKNLAERIMFGYGKTLGLVAFYYVIIPLAGLQLSWWFIAGEPGRPWGYFHWWDPLIVMGWITLLLVHDHLEPGEYLAYFGPVFLVVPLVYSLIVALAHFHGDLDLKMHEVVEFVFFVALCASAALGAIVMVAHGIDDMRRGTIENAHPVILFVGGILLVFSTGFGTVTAGGILWLAVYASYWLAYAATFLVNKLISAIKRNGICLA